MYAFAYEKAREQGVAGRYAHNTMYLHYDFSLYIRMSRKETSYLSWYVLRR